MRLPVTLPLGRSRSLLVAIVAAHLLAAAGVQPLAMPWPAKLAVLAALAASLAQTQRRSPVNAIVLKADGTLDVVCADGGETACEVEASTTVFPWLVVLRLRSVGRVKSLNLPVDALGAEGHRQLRLWLKWKAATARA